MKKLIAAIVGLCILIVALIVLLSSSPQRAPGYVDPKPNEIISSVNH